MTELDKTVAAADAAGVSYGKYILANGKHIEPKPEPEPDLEKSKFTRWTPDMVERLISMKEDGMSHAEIASALGMKSTAVAYKWQLLAKDKQQHTKAKPQPQADKPQLPPTEPVHTPENTPEIDFIALLPELKSIAQSLGKGKIIEMKATAGEMTAVTFTCGNKTYEMWIGATD